MEIYAEDIIDIYVDKNIADIPYFCIEDNYMVLLLYSDKIEKGHELTKRDRSELVTLINWVNKREILEWIDSPDFNMPSLYMFIRAKAAKDEDFLTWWNSFNFKISLFWYNRGRIYE